MSTTPNVDVDLAVDLRLVVPDADAVPMPVALRYCANDPYAVTVAFCGDNLSVEWVFARDLLLEGLSGPAGEGDVHISPATRGGTNAVSIWLSSPDGQAVLEADRTDLAAFLDRTTSLVPAGHENAFIDLDAEIATLLIG